LDTMKKVWKLRGTMKSSPLKGKHFVLEFGIEFRLHERHQERTMGFQHDIVLVEALKEGDGGSFYLSSNLGTIELHPFFYPLSKELSRDLGKKLVPLLPLIITLAMISLKNSSEQGCRSRPTPHVLDSTNGRSH
jgi:hypothetical protein